MIFFFKKELNLAKFIFTTHLNAFGSNVFSALKIMNFEDVYLTKDIHFYLTKYIDA
jgi:hypothetical protein